MTITTVFISRNVKDKIIKEHNVTAEEVREVILNAEDPPIFNKSKSKRYRALGRTLPGRYLLVAFVYQTSDIIRVLTAREMTKSERKWYLERRR